MNPKLAKFTSKAVFGLAVSAVIGIIIKAEHRIDDRIDEHYDKKSEDSSNAQ